MDSVRRNTFRVFFAQRGIVNGQNKRLHAFCNLPRLFWKSEIRRRAFLQSSIFFRLGGNKALASEYNIYHVPYRNYIQFNIFDRRTNQKQQLRFFSIGE